MINDRSKKNDNKSDNFSSNTQLRRGKNEKIELKMQNKLVLSSVEWSQFCAGHWGLLVFTP